MESIELQRKFHFERCFIADPLKIGNMYLVQIGRTHCTENYVIGEHPHRNWFEITYILDGEGEIVTNGISSPVKAGEMYLSFPGDIHSILTDKMDPLKFNFLSFYPEDRALLKTLEEIMILSSDPKKRIFTDKNIENLIDNSLSEVILNDRYSADMLNFALNQIVRYMIRAFAADSRDAKLKAGSSQELCYQMMNYVSTHIYVMDSLDTLAGYFGYSYSYLSGVFHKTTGETLMSYYTLRRLESAAMLIKENNLSVGEIAELLKYSSIYSFSRAFKNHFGKSPTEYKKQMSTQ